MRFFSTRVVACASNCPLEVDDHRARRALLMMRYDAVHRNNPAASSGSTSSPGGIGEAVCTVHARIFQHSLYENNPIRLGRHLRRARLSWRCLKLR